MNDQIKPPEDEEPAYCNVCGDPISGADVFCAGCGSPVHGHEHDEPAEGETAE